MFCTGGRFRSRGARPTRMTQGLVVSGPAIPHVDLALAEAALPGEEPEDWQDRALHHSLAWKAAEVAMAAPGTTSQAYLGKTVRPGACQMRIYLTASRMQD